MPAIGDPPSSALRLAKPDVASAFGKMPDPTTAPWIPGRPDIAAGFTPIMLGSSARAADPAKDAPCPTALCSRTS